MLFSIILLSVFLAGMIAIGVWGMRKTTNIQDFFLGGRTIGPWVSAIAYGTTYFSAVLFIGFAGTQGWGFGLNSLWIAAGNTAIGSFLAWTVLGRRTRAMSHNLGVMTMPEFLNERFGARFIKLFAAILIFVFLIPYSASVFKGLGYLFEANFNIPYDIALLIMIGITGVYLILGGYFAVTLTDFIQGLIMVFGAIAMVAILTVRPEAGGFGQVINRISEAYAAHVPAAGRPSGLLIASLVFMTSFGVWGMPQMVQKYYAIKNEKVIRTASVITTVFAFIIVFAAYFTGALSHVFLSAPPVGANGAAAMDRIIPTLLTTYLPPVLMGIILLLVLSASMSTLSSLVMVSASAVSIDVVKGYLKPKKDRSLMTIRIVSGVFIVFSYFIARRPFDLIVTLMSLSWGAIAGAFMAPFFYSLYWKKTTKAGVVAGMVCGMATSVTLFYVLGAPNSPIASSIGMIVPFLVVPVVSLMTKKPSQDLIDKAFAGIGKRAS